MSESHKKSTSDALNRFYEKEAKIAAREMKPTKRERNKAPEKEVEKECVKWMRDLGWSINVFEAKATWNKEAGCWLQQGMKAGTCDILGNDADGFGVAIELKAKGRLSTFNSDERYLQRKFIVDKINANCFACVVDGVERLATIYSRWKMLRGQSAGEARDYLLSMLPIMKEKADKDEPLFDE